MVKARDQVGVFASMDELNSLAKIKGAELLAQRFVEEMEDKTLVPVSSNFFFRWKHEGCSTPR